MSCQGAVYQWIDEVRVRFPHLSPAQATVLALWSFGMVVARSCALTAVSVTLAAVLGRKENTVRQQLREGVYEAAAKRGRQRREVVVRTCFVPLLRWVLAHWDGRQLALALDATSLGDRFVVLAISVVYRGCAIPVSWTVLPAGQKGAWRGEWLRLLRQLRPAVPRGWTVIVLADRGLYAPWLFRRIVRLGWHPFLRVNLGGTFRPACGRQFQPFRHFVPQPGTAWCGRGTAFKTKAAQLSCTLLARWEAGYRDPWLILTDLPPEASDAGWYGLRAWIEQGFKITKRAGWQWQRTRMTDPARAARLWLAVAVATLWLLRVGGEAEDAIPASTLRDVTAVLGHQHRQRRATRLRLVSVFRRGWVTILAALLTGAPLPRGAFRPEPWPTRPAPPLSAAPVPEVA
jgi:Transposase DDE domain